MSVKETKKPVQDVEKETVTAPAKEPAKKEEQPKPVYGYVTGCNKLNVRKEPNAKGEVVCVIDAATKVQIDLTKSNDEWYKVRVKGENGFCMKKYIAI